MILGDATVHGGRDQPLVFRTAARLRCKVVLRLRSERFDPKRDNVVELVHDRADYHLERAVQRSRDHGHELG
jgi:hypothetical protein